MSAHQLDHGKPESADGWLIVQAGMRSAPVVAMQPIWQMDRALVEGCVGVRISRPARCSTDKPLDLAVGEGA